jgi:hypothetical protein
VNLQGVGTKHFETPISVPEDALQVGHRLLIDLKGRHSGSGPQQSQSQRARSGANLDDVRIFSQRGLGGSERY